jgi:hypothetical protein
MGLFTATKEALKGNFRDAFNYAWIDEDNIAMGRDADNKLTTLVQEKYAAGAVSQEEAELTLSRIQLNAFPSYPGGKLFEQPGTNVALGFQEGLEEGAAGIGKFATKTISTATGLTWKIIPWQIWLALAIAAVVYAWPFIGPALAARALAKR